MPTRSKASGRRASYVIAFAIYGAFFSASYGMEHACAMQQCVKPNPTMNMTKVAEQLAEEAEDGPLLLQLPPESLADLSREHTTENKSQQVTNYMRDAMEKLIVTRQREKQQAKGEADITPHIQEGFISIATIEGLSKFLTLDITDLLDRKKPAQILVTAQATRGAWLDKYGQVVTLHEPFEMTENLLLGFKLTDGGRKVDVLQPQSSLRTTDDQTKEAFFKATWSPWVATLTNYGRDGKVVVDGLELIRYGFFVTGSIFDGYDVRVSHAKVFPRNVDIVVEYLTRDPLLVPVSYSILQLPETQMDQRVHDARLMYFTQAYTDLGIHDSLPGENASDSNDRKVESIWRYNLDSLPDKQIKIYVDPTVPRRWRSYFKDGIEMWNVAFAEIGMPNAIRGVLPEDEDWPEDYHPGDVRFSTVAWAIDIYSIYAMGIAKADPRSGEIIHSTVVFGEGWVKAFLNDFGNVRSTQYLNRGIRREKFTPEKQPHVKKIWQNVENVTELSENDNKHKQLSLLAHGFNGSTQEAIGQGLRDVVVHEVGHILGLRHNFKGTMGVSLECTRDKSCSAKHGITASVMDYIPVNQPSQGVENVDMFTPRVGAYDVLAIRYGYTPPASTGEDSPETREILKGILEEYEAAGLQTCSDTGSSTDIDPYCRPYDLSSDPLQFWSDDLDQVAYELKHIMAAYVPPGSSYKEYGDAVQGMLTHVLSTALKVVEYIGGVNISSSHRGYNGEMRRAARTPISKKEQMFALELLLKVLRPYSSGLLPKAELNSYLIGSSSYDGLGFIDLASDINSIQTQVVQALITSTRFVRLYAVEFEEGVNSTNANSTNVFTCDQLVSSLVNHVFGTDSLIFLSKSTEQQEWNLQMLLAESLVEVQASSTTPTQIRALLASYILKAKGIVAGTLHLLQGDATNDETAAARSPLIAHLLTLQSTLSVSFLKPSLVQFNTLSQRSSAIGSYVFVRHAVLVVTSVYGMLFGSVL